MKLTGLDIAYFVCAVAGFISLGVILGMNNCKIDKTAMYLFVAPIAGMIGIYFWQVGKRNKSK